MKLMRGFKKLNIFVRFANGMFLEMQSRSTHLISNSQYKVYYFFSEESR
jgi:hypothetical protein